MKLTWIIAPVCWLTVACAAPQGPAAETPKEATPPTSEPAWVAAPEPVRHGVDAIEMSFEEPSADDEEAAELGVPATRLAPTTASKGGELGKRH